jgi:uncharacterized membrane protein (UPF0127 family)
MTPTAQPDTSVAYAFNSDTKAIVAARLRTATTHWKRLVGLIGTRADEFVNGGLWIAPCHGVHTYAMKFSIDVVYLSPDNQVLHVEENVRPWSMTPIITEAASVLELPAHTVFQTGTAVGDHIELHLPGAEKEAA